jgi:CheY-like chemotaxis protein
VVILSADATPGQVDRLLAAGAHAYVTKPFDVKPFIEVIDDALEAREAA